MKYFLLVALILAAVPALPREREAETNARYGIAVADYPDGSSRTIALRLEPVECALSVTIHCPDSGQCVARDLPLYVPMCQPKRRATRR